ncbi:MAG: tetratricopeptide repeat protein [Candidatus Fermentibacteria bacterium]|nr:tetratricopeptide repeat protein [Candidatus Fermentibacteria bacterium]
MANGKCILCKTRKASRQCSKFDTFICSVCCAENREEKLCSDCIHFKTAENYRLTRTEPKKVKSIIRLESGLINIVDKSLELAESGKPGKARKELEKLNRLHPDNELIHFGIGVTHFFQENYQKAEACLKRAIEIDPEYTEAHFNLGALYKIDLDLYKSVIHFQKVVEIHDNADLVKKAKTILTAYENTVKESDGTDLKTFMRNHETFMLAFAEMNQKNWKRAIEMFNQVLLIIPNHLSSLGNIGMCYGQLAQYTKAITYLDRALEIDPEYEPAINNKAQYSVLKDGEAPPEAETVVTNYGKSSVHKSKKPKSRRLFFK